MRFMAQGFIDMSLYRTAKHGGGLRAISPNEPTSERQRHVITVGMAKGFRCQVCGATMYANSDGTMQCTQCSRTTGVKVR